MNDLSKYATEIVAAYVSQNHIQKDDLPTLIKSVHAKLGEIVEGVKSSIEPDREVPAVSIKKSVRHDYLICLTCGKHFRTLKRHLGTDHGMTLDEYKAHWSLPSTYPSTAPAYSERRSSLAKKAGLGRKVEAKAEPPVKVETVEQPEPKAEPKAHKSERKFTPVPKPKDRKKVAEKVAEDA